ncbi:MAG: VPLPA-CTERM sorting domain-containing protein [Gammaproteobacteria bacterium]|nr:VPLPA-CTERM sorting domain-containing protein [Gammaproteobacteria bacterium]
MKYWELVLASMVLVFSTSVHAAKVNVPGDFPGTFNMDLLGGNFYWSVPGFTEGFELAIDTQAKAIQFDASAFDNSSLYGEGTSSLTLDPINDWHIGTTGYFGTSPVEFYVHGAGTGTLVDNDTSTAGDWTLEVPMYATWNGERFDLPNMILTTSATYSYLGIYGGYQTISGTSMDYETGDAFLVGQSVFNNPDSLFHGTVVTLGFFANDPVVSAVPVPAAAWLFGSGLIGLAGFARRRKA